MTSADGAAAGGDNGKHLLFIVHLVFTPEEVHLFEMRVEEGCDLTPEGRYLEWLGCYHPELLETKSGIRFN